MKFHPLIQIVYEQPSAYWCSEYKLHITNSNELSSEAEVKCFFSLK